MHLVATQLATKLGLADGYRLVLNCRERAGQTVPHLHMHLLGGRDMKWPPGGGDARTMIAIPEPSALPNQCLPPWSLSCPFAVTLSPLLSLFWHVSRTCPLRRSTASTIASRPASLI